MHGFEDVFSMQGLGDERINDTELDLLKNAEFKEAFDEFDKVAFV